MPRADATPPPGPDFSAAIGLLGAVVAWADGQIDGVALLAALWGGVQACFIRAGIAGEVTKAQE